MTEEELHDAWNRQKAAEATGHDATTNALLNLTPQELSRKVAKAHRREQRYLAWLNVQEGLPAVGVAGFLAWQTPGAERPWAMALAASIALTIGCYLLGDSLRHHRSDTEFGDSIRDRLTQRFEQVSHRSRLFRNIAWWYFLPWAAIAALAYYAVDQLRTDDPTVVVGFGAFLVVMYAVNRLWGWWRYDREVSRLRPLLADFD